MQWCVSCSNVVLLHFTDCPLPVLTRNLPTDLLCHIPATCTSVKCCVTSHTPLNRSISVLLELDPCNQRILLEIENFAHQISLYDFTFGENKTPWIYKLELILNEYTCKNYFNKINDFDTVCKFIYILNILKNDGI